MLAVSVPLGITIAIVGALLSIVGSLIVLNLKSIKNCLRPITDRLNKQEERIDKASDEVKALQTGFGECKVDCERTFVASELFLRETGFARRSMENATASINRVEGKLDVVDKFPQICGDISREIVKQMQSRGDQ